MTEHQVHHNKASRSGFPIDTIDKYFAIVCYGIIHEFNGVHKMPKYRIMIVNFCALMSKMIGRFKKKVVTDRTFGSAQMTELFSAEHRTFFHIFVLLDDPHVRGVIIGL